MKTPKIYLRLRRLAKGSGITVTKHRGGGYTLTDDRSGETVKEKSIQDVAIRLQRLGVLGYGGAA